MADDAAHIPAGPQSDGADADLTDGFTRDAEDGAAEQGLGAASPRSDSASDQGTEMTGRQTASAAEVRSHELVAVGSGEAEQPGSPHFGDIAAEPSLWSGPRRELVDDRPQWTFPGVADEPSAVPTDGNQSELPFTAAAGNAPALAPPRPMPTFGPVGRSRSPLLVPVLSVLTLGVSALVWHHDVNRELEEFDPKLHSRPRRSTVAVMVPWLAGLLVTLAGATVIVTSRLGIHLPLNIHVATWQSYSLLAGLAAVPYLMLLVPFSAVAVVMTLERLRLVEEHVGATTDRQVRPVGTCLFLAVPLVGGLVLLAIEQRRLNAIWHAVTTSGHLYS